MPDNKTTVKVNLWEAMNMLSACHPVQSSRIKLDTAMKELSMAGRHGQEISIQATGDGTAWVITVHSCMDDATVLITVPRSLSGQITVEDNRCNYNYGRKS